MTEHISSSQAWTAAAVQAFVRRPGCVLVDVLPPESFAQAHIPGALSLPVADIPLRARQLLPRLHDHVLVYCGGPT